MMAVVAVVFSAFFFYYYSGGPDFGARYWYLMIIPLVALSARGMQALQQRLAISQPSELAGAQVLAAVAILALTAAALYIPWRAVDKYHHFWGMRPDVRTLQAAQGFGRSLVLVRGELTPGLHVSRCLQPAGLQRCCACLRLGPTILMCATPFWRRLSIVRCGSSTARR